MKGKLLVHFNLSSLVLSDSKQVLLSHFLLNSNFNSKCFEEICIALITTWSILLKEGDDDSPLVTINMGAENHNMKEKYGNAYILNQNKIMFS